MYYPKCGTENPDNAQKCSSCNCVLASTKSNAANPDSQKSALAIASFILGILGFYAWIPSIALGIVALIQIKKSAGLLKGKSLALAGIAIPSMVWLTCLSVPSVNVVRRFYMKKSQLAQIRRIQSAIELYIREFSSYPPSSAVDGAFQSYCGAMKLCEALMGWDLKGFHKDSVFRRDGMNEEGTTKLYSEEAYDPNVRIGPFLTPENVHRLNEIYKYRLYDLDGNNYVICDIYLRKRHSGKKTGMPILYYKADTSKNLHDPNTESTSFDSMGNIYNYCDNLNLLYLGRPEAFDHPHDLSSKYRFYKNTRNDKILTEHRPHKPDSYILISAGYDGEYGTADDICNYEWEYRDY